MEHALTAAQAKDKIRKLLALANNPGATEGEANNAMTMAAGLMAAYNITETQVSTDSVPVGRLVVEGNWDIWVMSLVSAAAKLNACDGASHVYKKDVRGAEFIGREVNREAAKMMLLYLVDEVEREYKKALPKGLTQARRSEFRRTFKLSCARRISIRASNIIYEMRKNDMVAKAATGSTALVVAGSFDQQMNDIKKWMENEGFKFKTRKSRGRGYGSGTEAGRAAGERIPLQKQLGN